ncbi:MAG: histidine kinase [Comamonadaceae bacterium]|nr:histidine kinase [Comamonadaceae bacterium]
MQALRAQIEPHFLWNTLANVEYLIRRDAPKAEAMMGHLIRYLRATVPDARRGSSTVASELDSVRAYLVLMGFRMGERLEWTVEAEASCGDVPMPPLVPADAGRERDQARSRAVAGSGQTARRRPPRPRSADRRGRGQRRRAAAAAADSRHRAPVCAACASGCAGSTATPRR